MLTVSHHFPTVYRGTRRHASNQQGIGHCLCGCQSFNICPIDQSKIKPPCTNVTPRQTSTSTPAYDPLAWPSYDSQQPIATNSLDTQARRWVLQCDADHVACRAARSEHSQNFRLPTRLIAIDEKDFTRVHLIDTTTDAVFGPYTTLRYIVWRSLPQCIPS